MQVFWAFRFQRTSQVGVPDTEHMLHLPVLELLLADNADVNSKNTQNQISLFGAGTNGHTAVVESLLVRGGIEVDSTS
jgi:ankyrin repeat protein